MPTPEHIILIGAGIWAGAALATSIPRERFDPGYPLVFSLVAVIGGLIGITENVPEHLDVLLTLVAAALFFLTPLIVTAYLYWRSDSAGKRPKRNNYET